MAVNRYLAAPGGPAAVAAAYESKGAVRPAAASGKAGVAKTPQGSQMQEVRTVLHSLYGQGWAASGQAGVKAPAQTAAFVRLCDLAR